jgi:uncharacterized PurR-regulated membrane protein YhhQ (DUF165 family)
LVNRFIGHLYTPLVTTISYSAIVNTHTLQITRAHVKSSQFAFTSRFLVTDLNNEDYSASVLTSLMSGEYPAINSLSQSQSHIATDGQSISKSWCRAPSGAHDKILITL